MTKPHSPAAVVTEPTVDVDGHPDRTVRKGEEFLLLGSGFQPDVTSKICLTGQPCEKAATDAEGNFVWPHTLYYIGVYTIHVYQGTSQGDPPLQYTGTLTVVD